MLSHKIFKVNLKTLFLSALLLFLLTAPFSKNEASAQVQITSCDQLIGSAAAGTNLRDNPSETYNQANDIDCGGQTITVNFPSSSADFTGVYNGGGFEISNFIVDPSNRASLFGYTEGATIQNLSIDNAQVSCNTGGNCGILTADDRSSTFDGITITNSTLIQDGGQDNMGALFGVGLGSQVSNITINTVSVTCTQFFSGSCERIGGAIGSLDQNAGVKGSINNVTAINLNINGKDDVGGVVGYLGESNISNSSAQGNVNGYDSVGGVIGYIIGDATLSSTATNLSANTTYDPQAYLDIVGTTSTNTNYTGGLIGRMENYSSLDCGGLTTNYNVRAVASTANVGGISGLTNFELASSDVDSFKIQNCNVDFYIEGRSGLGGIVGNGNEGRMNNVQANGVIKISGTSPSNIGGIYGIMDFDSPSTRPGLANCSFTGQIFSSDSTQVAQNIGGIMGDVDNVSIDTCNVISDISSLSSTRVGGILGQGGGTNNSSDNYIANSSYSGTISGRTNVGGILGASQYYDIINSSSSGEILGDTENLSQYFGGLIGFSTGSSTDISNVSGSSSSMDISQVVRYAGGLIGYSTFTSVVQSYATGDITGYTSNIGGLIGGVASGSASVLIDQVYTTGKVEGGTSNIGGLIGDSNNATQISNAYAFGSVVGKDFVGGLIGSLNNGTLIDSFSTGLVAGVDSVGGLIGQGNTGTSVTESYWDLDTSNQSTSYAGIGKTTLELFTPSTFNTWDTDTIWEACDNAYPVLRNLGQSCPVPDPVIFYVNSTQDTEDETPGDGVCADSQGSCTLRSAIQEVNALNNSALNIINFQISDSSKIIQLESPLPTLSNLQVSIDGTSQAEYVGEPVVAINASNLLVAGPILQFSNTDDSSLKGLAIYGLTQASDETISITNSDNFKISNNLFGYSLAGEYTLTSSANSLSIDNSDNLIIQNNRLANSIYITDSNSASILNNTQDLSNNSTSDYAIQFVDGQNSIFRANNISNVDRGIVIRDDASSVPVTGHQVTENLGENVLLMIDLLDDGNANTNGKNPNDLDDEDEGPNNLLNSPALTSASYDNSTRTLTVDGIFDSLDGNYRFDFYASDGADEAREYLSFFLESLTGGSLTFTAKNLTVPERGIAPSFVTATAQDSEGNTSEHSQPVAVDAIIITSCDQLAGGNPAAVANHIEDDYSEFYRLANNIDCSTYSGGNSFDPIGSNTSAEYFTGVLDGAGFTISNLEITETSSYIGLFARTNGAIIQNLNIKNTSITCSTTTADYCGAIAGYSDQSAFRDINLLQGTGSGVSVQGTYSGGLVGYVTGTEFINIASDLDITSPTDPENYTGGLVGYTRYLLPTNRAYIYSVFENVNVTGDVQGYFNTGGIVGYGQDVLMSDSSYSGQITHSGNTVGGLFGSVNSYTFSDLTSKVENSSVNLTTVSTATASRNELGGIAGEAFNTQFKNITVQGAIDATDYTIVGGAFGFAQGDNTQTENNQLVTSTPSTIEYLDIDIDIQNANVTVGGAFGNISYYKISNISYEGAMTHDSPSTNHSAIGGLIGTSNYIDLRNSSVDSLTPISYALTSSGGAIGVTSNAYVENVSSAVAMPGVGTTGGGLIGDASNLNIYNSYSTGNVGVLKDQSTTTSIGGLIGRCRTTFCNIYNSYSTGDVIGERISVGGLVGNLNATNSIVQNSYATGNVTVESFSAGGLIGELSPSSGQSNITGSYSSGSVSSIDYGYLGGLIGRTGGSGTINILESYSSTTLNTPTSQVTSFNICGGLIGEATTTINITRSYSYGDINCPSITASTSSIAGVGGLVGTMDDGSILESYSHSDIVVDYFNDTGSRFARVGGLVGDIDEASTITDSYAAGSITNQYTPTDPQDQATIGGLVAESVSTTYIDSFWDTQTTGYAVSAGGTGILTSEMQDQNTFTTNGVDWNFTASTGTWEMCPGGGYPTHQWMNYCPLDDPYNFVVNSINDTSDAELGDRTCLDNVGNCTLRAALEEINFMVNNEAESINYNLNFNIAGAGPHIIALDNSLGILPSLTVTKVTIDGESEPSYAGSPVVFVDGSNLTGPDGPLLTINESTNTVIRGLGFINLDKDNDSLVTIQSSSNITFDNNFVGLDSASNPDNSSSLSKGLSLLNTTSSSVINSSFGRGVEVVGNSNSNTVGENTLNLSDSGRNSAIFIESSSQNTIESNQISNAPIGIIVNEPTGSTAIENKLTQNTATGLTNKMIELQVDAVASADTNDIAQDLDNGANTLLNFPIINDGEFNNSTNTLSVQGVVETTNGTNYVIEFYNSDGANDEALDYLGASDPFTVSGNSYSFDVDLTGIGVTPLNTTAILIDQNGNTSQHSQPQSLNEPPTDILISQNTFQENPEGSAFDTTTIATLTAVDADGSDTHTFEIISIDGDTESTIFSIGGFDGDSLIQNVPFDYESQTSYALLIRTTDNKGVSFQKTITISITDLNDVAPDLTAENFSVAENNPSPAATLTVIDPDTVGTLTLTITGGVDQNDFEISGTTLEFKDSSLPLDFETKTSYTVEVTVSDGANPTDTEVFNFSVTDVNEPPTLVSPQADISATQDQAITPIDLNNNFDDQDAGTNGQINISAVENGQITLPDWLEINAGVITGTPSNSDVGSVDILVTAADQPGLTTTDIFTIAIANVNDAPVIDDQTIGAVSESGPDGVAVGIVTASDPDAPYGDTLTYSIVSGNDDVDGDSIMPYAIDENTGEISVADQGDLDYETSQISVLQVTVTDSGTGNLSASAEVTIELLDANDTAPIFVSPASFTIPENQTEVATVQVTDVDSANTFTYTVTGGSDVELFQIDSETGLLEFIAAPDNENPLDANLDNIYQVEVTVDDGNSNQSTQLISIQITNVEEDSDVQPSTSGSSGGSEGGSSPFQGSDSSNDTDDSSSENDEDPVEETIDQDPEPEQTPEEENDSEEQNEPEQNQAEENETQETDSETETTEEDNTSQGGSQTPSEPEQTPEEENDSEEPNEPEQDQVEENETQEPDSQENQDDQNNSSSGSSGGGGGGLANIFRPKPKLYKKPAQPVVSCESLSSLELSQIENAELDCSPLEVNLAQPDRPTILLNLPQEQSTQFPSDEVFITGKVFELEEVKEVEVYAELNDGSQFAIGVAEVDVLGNFSLLNNKPLPKDTVVEIKARAIAQEDIVSPDYPIQINTQALPKIPTELISFTGKPESSLLQNENGYFSFVDTEELLAGLELRLQSEFRTKHDVYWNSVLIGSSAITGSNTDQTVIYAPEAVVADVDPYSRHKITIVAQNLDNPDQKGVPLVINYLYIPTYAYYASYIFLILLAVSAFIVTRKRLEAKQSNSDEEVSAS